ncbi:MAG: Npt1/Npt2 family nucleotide transporter [Xanthomonadales bacterium]|nr:Npt1/Npt2 family nucleotide transporter [Xanthomonadales bacterium]
MDYHFRRNGLERFLELFTKLRAGEGISVLLFFSYAFLLLVCYYLLKTVREPLLLVGGSAELKSYAYAAIAVILLVLVPVYSAAFRHTSKRFLVRGVTLFFMACLLVLYGLGRAGVDIGFAYYVWVGIFNVVVIAQFWAYAADTYNLKSGQRLFPVIMVGATLGGLAGPVITGALFPLLGPWNLMLLAFVLLAATLPFVGLADRKVPDGSRALYSEDKPERSGLLGGFAVVFADRYLLLLACMAVLLNWVNTTGEYILTELVVRYADGLIATDASLDKGNIIAAFYSNFFFVVNLMTVGFQVFLVARLFRWIGVSGAVMILPVIAFIGYGLVVFVPVFAIIRAVKMLENSTDYSIQNTTRHALYLPLSEAQKYEGKTTIDSFFWRFGDLVQAGVIFAGLNWFGFTIENFAMLNMGLALVWLAIARQIGRRYAAAEQSATMNLAPQLVRPLADQPAPPGSDLNFRLPPDAFIDPDAGDVLTITASGAGGAPLPPWLSFEADTLTFRGQTPDDIRGSTELHIRAADFDGACAEGVLMLRHKPAT